MKRNGKLLVALHALVHLERHSDEPVTSETLAACQDTNPVVIRRTMGLLRDGGLVRSVKGPGGGWNLARSAEAISLRDISAALGEPIVDVLDPLSGSDGCLVVQAVSGVMDTVLRDVRALLADRLAQLTLADLAADVAARYAGLHSAPERTLSHGS